MGPQGSVVILPIDAGRSLVVVNGVVVTDLEKHWRIAEIIVDKLTHCLYRLHLILIEVSSMTNVVADNEQNVRACKSMSKVFQHDFY